MFIFVDDIGMFANNRPRFDITSPDGTVTRGSCNSVATAFCKKACYNTKLEKVFTRILRADIKNEQIWQSLTGVAVAAFLRKKRKFTARIRGMTRGENFSSMEDVWRWREILLENPNSVFWLPTHAWWDPAKERLDLMMVTTIEQDIMTLPNARVSASVEPGNEAGWAEIEKRGWGVMFFGDNARRQSPGGLRAFLCPKTWKGLKGHCAVCRAGCFDPQLSSKRYVHLKRH